MGQKYSVVFDISKNKPFGNDISSYNDTKGNSVRLLRKDHSSSRAGDKFPGFKIYMHMLPEVGATYSYYLEAVYYGNNLQEGLDQATMNIARYIEVYFWEADYDNICPLFLDLGDLFRNPSLYNSSGIRSDKWTKLKPQSYDTIKEVFENAVVINLQKTSGSYTSHPSKDSFKTGNELHGTKFPTMTVMGEEDQPCQGYITITQHLEEGKPMNILSTWSIYKNNYIRFKESIIQNRYENAKIYYSACNSAYANGERNGDTDLRNPLILELEWVNDGQGTSEFYTRNKDDRWEKSSGISVNNLTDYLDEQSCKYNNIFVVDISKKTGNYSCGSYCKRHKTDVSTYATGNIYGYKNIQHLPSGGLGYKLGRIKRGETSLTLEGLTFPIPRVSQVLVYYPKCNPAEPILLRIHHGNAESEWFKRVSMSSNEWKIVSEEYLKKVGHVDNSDIKKVLDDLVCKQYGNITMDLTKGIYGTGKKYCCHYHTIIGAGRVTVEEIPVRCKLPDHDPSHTTAYKHSISDSSLKLAGIIFYLNDDITKENRKRIAPRTLGLPIEGPVHVYAFYCTQEVPVLIYVASSSKPNIAGWYQKPNDSSTSRGKDEEWTPVPSLQGITPKDFSTLSCDNWNKLREVLKKFKCEGLQECLGQNGVQREEVPAADLSDQVPDTESDQEKQLEASNTLQPDYKNVKVDPDKPELDYSDRHDYQDSLEKILGVITCACLTSGIAIFAGWKLYKRYKGDPWVKQI
ncbi:hypothetical protein BEWA_034350 [Theileria equi strain WA]|uniref:Complement component 3 CUB domain-containing protein n=1 Tax=Theileria equi strain WA TaxID=1537102 RepID=L0AZ92_THEEQ|nr:hypothetical protein BEWA_034350 [Theileria equi strain WA]AFZ80578.1 hypothetical protein BEWA_034350 [Theileria equi strain WA]|eukprot:XP_004830244.1 hypothetical protein BEWA_034350 [Theileria equi strain WA]